MKAIKASLRTLLVQIRLSVVLACCCMGCAGHTNSRFTVVATTSIIGDAVRQIVQDYADVITLMGPGVDPHAYGATQRDVDNLLKANIIFYNGLHLEGKMASILCKLGKNRPVYAAGDALKADQKLVDPHFSMGVDPHIWLDVVLWKQVVQYMSDRLQAANPEMATHYRANTAQYLQQLDQLHQVTYQAVQQIPPAQRVLITAHDAFGYFGRAYGLEVRGLQGISTVSEFGLKDVTNLIDFIIQRNIKAIFLETSVPDKPLKAVLAGCKNRKHLVKVGGYLFSDALGQLGTPEGSYCGMMHANVQTIVNALR